MGGSDPQRHAPRRGAFVPDEGALIDSVAKQGGGFAEIFAVRFLGRVRGLRNAISQGDNEMVIVCAMALGAIGTELSMTQHWHLAESIYEGSRKGEAEAAQGRVPYAKLRELYAKEMAAGAKRKQAYAAVAKKTNVNPRTVQRAVTGY